MILFDILKKVKESFDGFDIEHELASNILLLKVKGLDSCSLAKWIRQEFTDAKVTVKELQEYKFSDASWIKVEYNTLKGVI
jgi:hypothetical protein